MHVCAASNGDAPSPAAAPAAAAPRSALDELYDFPQPTSQAQPSEPLSHSLAIYDSKVFLVNVQCSLR